MLFQTEDLKDGPLPCDECGRSTTKYYVLRGEIQISPEFLGDSRECGISLCYKCKNKVVKLVEAAFEGIKK